MCSKGKKKKKNIKRKAKHPWLLIFLVHPNIELTPLALVVGSTYVVP